MKTVGPFYTSAKSTTTLQTRERISQDIPSHADGFRDIISLLASPIHAHVNVIIGCNRLSDLSSSDEGLRTLLRYIPADQRHRVYLYASNYAFHHAETLTVRLLEFFQFTHVAPITEENEIPASRVFVSLDEDRRVTNRGDDVTRSKLRVDPFLYYGVQRIIPNMRVHSLVPIVPSDDYQYGQTNDPPRLPPRRPNMNPYDLHGDMLGNPLDLQPPGAGPGLPPPPGPQPPQGPGQPPQGPGLLPPGAGPGLPPPPGPNQPPHGPGQPPHGPGQPPPFVAVAMDLPKMTGTEEKSFLRSKKFLFFYFA